MFGIKLYQPELLAESGMTGENLNWIESVDSLGNKLDVDVALLDINRTASNHFRHLPVEYFVSTTEVVRSQFSESFNGIRCNKIEIKKINLTVEGYDDNRHQFAAINEKSLRTWWALDENCE